MAWSKIKTIIIYILLLLNGFLLALVGVIQFRSAQYQAAAISEAAAVLELNDISVDGELPPSMPLSTITVPRVTAREAEVAAVLLGDDARIRSTTGGLHLYEAEAGNASFRSGGEFSAAFTEPIPVPEGSDRVGQALGYLERLELDIWQITELGGAVTAIQRFNSTPVFSSGVTAASQAAAGVTFLYDEEGRLSSIAGRLVLGHPTGDANAQEALSVPTVLIAFFNFVTDNGDACHSIHEMLPVYRAASMSDPIRLTPAWRISTDIGDYFLDAYTAEVTRVAGA